MKRGTPMKAISVAVLALCSGYASASGFQLIEQNASGIGNAFAGSAAVAENASTIFYNPAGMTQLQDREVSGGIAMVKPSFTFTDSGSSNVGAFQNTGNGGDAGSWAALPNGYLSWALNKDLYLGLGIGAPFGLMTEYKSPWQGAAQSTKFDVKTMNINPSVAFRVNETVSIGGGLNWQKLDVEYKRLAGIYTTAQVGVPLSSSNVTLKLKDDAWGWNVGALFTLSPATKVGVSYRSAIKYTAEGTVSVDGPSATFNAARSSNAKTEVKLPDTFILSVAQNLSDRWDMLGDVSWTGWAKIPKIDIMNSSTGSATPIQTLDTEFRNTWRVALGANYKYTDALKFKFGIAYDQSPVKGASTRLVSLPDNNRLWFSTGVQWKLDKASALDAGLAYLYVKDAKISNNQGTLASPYRGLVDGTYADSCWIVGAQYSLAF
ncbi:transporter [Rhodocyclus tenuis]|uniref:Transporter n=2 Tax=Rhodocyclus TaxID=1064 RepID=A0A6L5K1S8_RHOTE|nr:transporter [Rhodocyclus gracilis]